MLIVWILNSKRIDAKELFLYFLLRYMFNHTK